VHQKGHNWVVTSAIRHDLPSFFPMNSFVIRVVEIDLLPRAGGGTDGSDLIPKFLLDLWVLGEFEGGEGQCVDAGFV